jgi:hypothetical protein
MLIRLLELSPYEYQNCFNINESYTVNIKERYTDFRTQTILMDHVSLWHTQVISIWEPWKEQSTNNQIRHL